MPEHKTMQGESTDWLILKLIYASLKVRLAHRWPIIGNYLVLSYLLQDTDDNVSLTFFLSRHIISLIFCCSGLPEGTQVRCGAAVFLEAEMAQNMSLISDICLCINIDHYKFMYE